MASTESDDRKRYEWRPWKVAVVGLAGLLVALGAIIASSGDGEGAPARTVAGGGSGGASSGAGDGPRSDGDEASRLFEPLPESGGGSEEAPEGAPDSEGGGAAGVDPGAIDWSPALLRGGFSFLVAFGVAFALRTFMKLAIFFLGVWGASMFLLANVGWIEVHWGAIEAAWGGLTTGLGAQFESFGRFVTGSLPTTGLAGLGLYTGLRRR